MTSAPVILTPDSFSTWIWTATSGRCSSFCEFDDFAGEFDALGDGRMRQIHELAPGERETCQRADVCSLIKAILKHLAGLQLDGFGLVDLPPEELVALDAGGVARLGQAVRHDVQ